MSRKALTYIAPMEESSTEAVTAIWILPGNPGQWKMSICASRAVVTKIGSFLILSWRIDIRTNLIDSYDRLMAFIAKHLPDKFYLEGTTSISLRDRLFREVVSNLLINRAFSNAFPAKLIIEKDRVYTENWSHAHGWGQIDPQHFTPFPKNPTIAKFFKEIGMADELGSGVRNVFRYGPAYARGAVPELVEGDVFKTVIPIRRIEFPVVSPKTGWPEIRVRLGEKLGERLGENECRILEILWQNQAFTIPELAKRLKISTTAVENNIAKLKKKGLLDRVGSDKKGHWKINV
jgi:ATP-dependent DNA helicase RecG